MKLPPVALCSMLLHLSGLHRTSVKNASLDPCNTYGIMIGYNCSPHIKPATARSQPETSLARRPHEDSSRATALILVGICTVILVFICLILFIQKIRRDKIDRKVTQDADGLKPQPTEEATNATLHPNPLSLLPPALLQALANLTLSAVNRTDEHLPPSFLTMEPPQSSNSLGRLWFSVYYDYVQATLVLRILHARYTKGRGSSTKPGDVWIESCVMTPMNIVKDCTNTDKRRASSAPVFNQTFKFKVADEEVTQFLLRMTMYDQHPQNGEKAVGSVIVPLSTVDLCSNQTISRDIQ